MARRGRGGNDEDVRPRTPNSPLLFLSLPDIAHNNVSFFLPAGDWGNGSRLRVSEVSRALLSSHGTSLTRIIIRFVESSSTGRLTYLLRRLRNVKEVTVNEQEAIPPPLPPPRSTEGRTRERAPAAVPSTC